MYDAHGGEDGGEDRVMQQDTRDTRLTYDDFLLFPDDGLRHEIIDGEHYVTPSPNTRHQLLLGRLYFEIELYLRAHHGHGQAFVSPLDVVFSKWDVVEPETCCSSLPIRRTSSPTRMCRAHRRSSSKSRRREHGGGMSRSSGSCSIAAAFANTGSSIPMHTSSACSDDSLTAHWRRLPNSRTGPC